VALVITYMVSYYLINLKILEIFDIFAILDILDIFASLNIFDIPKIFPILRYIIP
jgi:hypothetical protein